MKKLHTLTVIVLIAVSMFMVSCGEEKSNAYIIDDGAKGTASSLRDLYAIPMGKEVTFQRSNETITNYGEGMVSSSYINSVYSVKLVSFNDTGNAVIEVHLVSVDLSIPQQNGTFEFDSQSPEDEYMLGKDILFGYNILLGKTAKMEYNAERGWTSTLNWEDLFDYGRSRFMFFPAKEDQYKDGFIQVVAQIIDLPFVKREKTDLAQGFKVISKTSIDEGVEVVYEFLFKSKDINSKTATFDFSGSVVENASFTTEDQGVKVEMDISDTRVSGDIEVDLRKNCIKSWDYKVKGTRDITYSKGEKVQHISMKYEDIVEIKLK